MMPDFVAPTADNRLDHTLDIAVVDCLHVDGEDDADDGDGRR